MEDKIKKLHFLLNGICIEGSVDILYELIHWVGIYKIRIILLTDFSALINGFLTLPLHRWKLTIMGGEAPG